MTFDAHYALGVLAGLACAAVLRPSFRQMAIAVWEWKTERLRDRLTHGDFVWFCEQTSGWHWGKVTYLEDYRPKWNCLSPLMRTALVSWGNEGTKEKKLCLLSLYAEPPRYILSRDYPRPPINKPIS